MIWLLALASSVLLVLCFPGYNFTWLAPVALTPLLIAAAIEKRPWRRFWAGYAFGVVYWFGVCNWIQWTIHTHGGLSIGMSWFVFALFCLAKALQTAAFSWLAGWTMQSKLAVPATAALWVLMEYTHQHTGFAWLHLGNAAIDMSLPLRIAPIAGVWGISFLFAAIAAEVANLICKRPGIPGFSLVLLASLFLLPTIPAAQEPTERAILVQPNIDETTDFTPESFTLLVNRMRALSLEPLNAQPRPQLLIWPEAPAPFYDTDAPFMDFLRSLAREANVSFLAGLVAHTTANGILNSAVLFDPQGNIVSRYDKINLVPFGEFVPWPLGPIAFKVSNEAGDFVPGTRQVVSPVGVHRMATFICYESVFPRFISRFVENGAEVLFNPSNDGWFGKTSARYQHLEIVRMRAVENQRWILRDTNDGITAAIDPAGRLRQTLPPWQEASTAAGFNYEKAVTPYTRYGDWFVAVCLFFAAAGIYSGTSTRVRISSRMRSPASARRPPSALRG